MTREWEKAIASGNVEQTRAMLDAGVDINSVDRYGQTAVMKAAHQGHVEIVRLLIERGASLNHTAKYGLSALMLAVISNHPEVVEQLIAGGANVALRSNKKTGAFYDRTALELASQMGHIQCAEILMKNRENE